MLPVLSGPLLLLTSSLVLTTWVNAQSSSSSTAPPFVTPRTHYSVDHSFRGLTPAGKVQGYGVSGHATALAGVHDFLRLVPPSPMAHGAVFSTKPLTSEEWIVEIAFRIHGPPAVGFSDEEGNAKKVHKGGRGLAFWFTKEGNPGPVTISSDQALVAAPPPPAPLTPSDPSDPSTSLFGSRTKFDGLGVIFDTAPKAPLYRRSDPRNWAGDAPFGVSNSAVVSGILDDGSGEWLEPDKRVMGGEDNDEAAYLEKAIGECEAVLRGNAGLLWSRISYVNHTIRVDLDLAPHTTLSKAGRDYAHNCFSLPGLKLSPGSYLGISGLASGFTEPDTVDVYAMDVFEVLKPEEPLTPSAVADEPVDPVSEQPLEGTSEDGGATLAHEIFLSQARMVEAIDALARKVDALSRTVRSGSAPKPSSSGGSVDPNLDAQLSRIEARLLTLSTNQQPPSYIPPPIAPVLTDNKETITHLLQLQDRLMVEIQALARKLDTNQGQSIASLATLSSRSAESLELLKNVREGLEDFASKGVGSWVWIVLGLGGVGVVGLWVNGKRRRDGGWQGGKKMI